MKEKIHPQYKECTVTCGCGNSFVTQSTKSALNVEICSSCHPFYTGKQKFVDTAGRVEKFQKRHSWDDSAMDKILQREKDAPKTKRPSRKQERVTVGLPPIRRKKGAVEEPEPEAGPRGRGDRRGGREASAGTGGPAQEASPPKGAPARPTASKAGPPKAGPPKPAPPKPASPAQVGPRDAAPKAAPPKDVPPKAAPPKPAPPKPTSPAEAGPQDAGPKNAEAEAPKEG